MISLPQDWRVRAQVYVTHLVDTRDDAQEAALRAWMQGQIRYANEAFARAGNHVSFALAQHKFVADPAARQSASTGDVSLHRQLYHPNYQPYENVFVVVSKSKCDSGACIVGGAYLPSDYETTVTNHYVWLSETAKSSTFVHEMGHVLNLLHTFHRQSRYPTCTILGDDGVADTAMERLGYSRCTESPCTSDSCPQQPGCDPCSNLMSYHSGADRFTDGQIDVIRSYFEKHPLAYAAWAVDEPLPDPDAPDESSGLGGGVIAGIVIAVVVVIGIAVWVVCARRNEDEAETTTASASKFPSVLV